MIPVYYLEEEKPFVCGVTECSQRFSTYKLLQFHAKSHPDISLGMLCEWLIMKDRVLQNQQSLPSGPVYCPVLGCEVEVICNIYIVRTESETNGIVLCVKKALSGMIGSSFLWEANPSTR